MATARPFAYNPPPNALIDGTEQVGELAIGTPTSGFTTNPRFWNGPDEDLGYVIAHPTPSGNQPNPLSIPAYLGFWRSDVKTDNSFINLAEYVSNYNNTPQTFSSATEASVWLTNNGYWNSWGTSSLYLDSGNPSSYPGSGITWYDIGGNNNNGTLQNGVTYSPSYGGILQFDSNNSQYVSFSSPTDIPTGSSNYTINSWFNASSNGTLGIVGWGSWGAYNQVNALRLGNNSLINYWWGNDMAVSYNYNTGQWYNLCVTFDGVYRTMYLNGNQVGQDAPGLPNVSSSSNMQVGTTNGSEYFNGSIPIVEIYNKSLTSAEILNNWNTTKSRFGL